MQRTALFVLMTVAAQPVFGVQAALSSKHKIAIGLGVAACITAAIHLLFAKSDAQVCNNFIHEIGEKLDALQGPVDRKAVTNVYEYNMPPLFSRNCSLNNTTVGSRNGQYRARITHKMTKRGIYHDHKFSTTYETVTNAN